WRETHLYAALENIDEKNWEQAIYYIRQSKIWPENMGVGKPYHVDERLEDFMEFYCLLQDNQEVPESLIDSIKYYRDSYKTTPYGSTDFLTMLMFQYAGEFTKVYTVLANWLRQDANGLAIQWSKAFINGNIDEVNLIGSKKQVPIEALPYETPFDDRSFPFIKELYKRGIFENFKLIEEKAIKNLSC
ncbi:MAG: Tetratricopeptide domain protein, partial [Mucilaginibacter sp.]|nr:Tetratricopeptide domain protein [Mucilaginibacter sp.]